MKRSGLLVLALVGSLSLQAAEQPPAPAATPAASPAKKLAPLKYKAPTLPEGTAGTRISGGTRGGTDASGAKLPSLEVLAPNHVALTSQAQPTLFWYQSAPAKVGFQITLTEPQQAKPMLKLDVDNAESAGIRALSLARQNVTLKPNVTYRWSIALIPDKTNRSKDVIASGVIKRVDAPASLEEKLTSAGAAPAERAGIYAEAGLWYDALQAISTAIAAEPQNVDLHQRRAALLKQVGLDAAAGSDHH